ncbi:hypothetical protein F511_18792 [Dorcoceras hygrometricum]|uniref:Nucleotide-diphospho-sugar transferase domain-containing protein n=1 Tax=Dorcoceras hygrometricum TaxID=472368 RepID=A0A2Z7ADJ6_9LAMI|nr:hypothetical protein F511_18792 [Dorcoceras hygrometricum]
MAIDFEDGGTNRNHHDSKRCRHGHHHHRRNHDLSRLVVRILLLSMVVGLIYLVLSQSYFPIQLIQRSYSLNCSSPTCKSDPQTASSSSDETTHGFTYDDEDFPSYDADVMWLRDPFPRFDPDADFQIACDVFKSSTDPSNIPNGGFNYVKSNPRTIKFYRFWYRGRHYFPGKHDQDVLEMIKMSPYISEIGLEIRYLDTAFFGGFCEPSKDLDLVCTMHANCCVGLGKKMHDLRMVIEDWRRYMAHQHTSVRGSWSAPWKCRSEINR